MFSYWFPVCNVAGHIDLRGQYLPSPHLGARILYRKHVPNKNSVVNNPVGGQIHVCVLIWEGLPPCLLQLCACFRCQAMQLLKLHYCTKKQKHSFHILKALFLSDTHLVCEMCVLIFSISSLRNARTMVGLCLEVLSVCESAFSMWTECFRFFMQ